MDDIFAIQDDITEKNAAQLKLILLTNDENTEELDPTSNVAAYEMF
jgi:hypothetical protein